MNLRNKQTKSELLNQLDVLLDKLQSIYDQKGQTQLSIITFVQFFNTNLELSDTCEQLVTKIINDCENHIHSLSSNPK
jgi:hypothetical protein